MPRSSAKKENRLTETEILIIIAVISALAESVTAIMEVIYHLG